MGNPTHPIHRRLGVSFIPKGSRLRFPYSKELRGDLDLYGWDRPTPSRSRSETEIRLDLKRDLLVQRRVEDWVDAQSYRLVRVRLKDNYSHLGVHVFVWPKQGWTAERMAQYEARTSQPSEFVRRFALSSNEAKLSVDFLEESLDRVLQTEIRPTHPPVRLYLYDLSQMVNRGNLGPIWNNSSLMTYRRKPNYVEAFGIMALMREIPVRPLLTAWLADLFTSDKSPRLGLGFVRDLCAAWSAPDVRIQGLMLRAKGRLGGVDKAVNQSIRWGQMPREAVSAGVSQRFAEAYTAQGRIGVRVLTYY